MSANYATRHQELVHAVLAQGKKLPAAEARFVQVFYDKLMVEMLAQFAPARALEIARYCYGVVRDQLPNAVIHCEEATLLIDGVKTRRLRMVLLNRDMPFLVDSVTATLQRLNVKTHILMHPILALTRDAKGAIKDLSLTDDLRADVKRESLIYLELTPLPQPLKAEGLREAMAETLAHVRAAVTDWKAMDAELARVQKHFDGNKKDGLHREEIADFLTWLRHKNFVFLGMAHYRSKGKAVLRDAKASYGIYRLPMPEEAIEADTKNGLSSAITISKASAHAKVHRNVAMDYITLRLEEGELRLLGLFTSNVYYQSAMQIPFLRKKLANVLLRSGFDPVSHSGKALKTILEFLPRDEVFQMREDELFAIGMGVLTAEAYPQVRLFTRADSFGRYISALVYVPRDRFSTTVREQISRILERAYGGKVIDYYTQITDSPLARLHVFISQPKVDGAKVYLPMLEEKISTLVNVWEDALRDALVAECGEAQGEHLAARYTAAFDSAYVLQNPAAGAVHDIAKMEACLSDPSGLALELFRRPDEPENQLHLKSYTTNLTAALSDILPMLEHMNLTVRNATPFEVSPKHAAPILVRDFALTLRGDTVLDVPKNKARIEDALARIWRGECTGDALNALLFTTTLHWREIEILRGYVRYLQQANLLYRTGYVMQVLTNHPAIAAHLVTLFHAKFDPKFKNREAAMLHAETAIVTACEQVSNLSEDRILRRLLAVVKATLRTNYYQTQADGSSKHYLSFKLRSAEIPDLPMPVPYAEIFVTSPRVEGIHLRGDKVARGGLRWSDRPEDFRTEILGLVKAQMVKNAVIVPSGAKGGFVLRQAPTERDALQAEGIACYKIFLSGLLDITDNIVNGSIVPPPNTVRHDGDDPYLVVAADKGTASFSDIANGVAADYGFWLGDAFASGGSVGYDHKAMAITAKGAWVAVERHFREMGRDVMREPFTAVGIGDMSGDVFGNGLLLSPHYKLVAAFNHKHIFLDPTPDAKVSFAERKRLFNLPRSGWNDYNPALISKGGGVFERSAKTIALSKEVREALSTDVSKASPDELIQLILKARVDLLWNGGIGTYVKASSETHDEVGDRSNNAVRVNGREVRALVVGEGGNLGFTQRGRIEYARTGGRINTDAIDNSAGVDCSDHEVNIKIAFGAAMAAKRTTRAKRDVLLRDMTDAVAHLVLEDNRLQTQALTLAEMEGTRGFETLEPLMRQLERGGALNRDVEALPHEKQIAELKAAGLGLTRPELSVLLAYAKLDIARSIKDSALLDAPYYEGDLLRYFPEKMRKSFGGDIRNHPLKREIIATKLTNSLVNRMGIGFAHAMQRETGLPMMAIVQSYCFARDAFGLRELWKEIEALDGQVHTIFQAKLFDDTREFTAHIMRWVLAHVPQPMDLDTVMPHFTPGIMLLQNHLRAHMAPAGRDTKKDHQGVSQRLASQLAMLPMLAAACDIVEISSVCNRPVPEVGAAYFAVGEHLKFNRLRELAKALRAETHWHVLANQAVLTELYQAQHRLTLHLLAQHKSKKTSPVEAWLAAHEGSVQRYMQTLAPLESQDTIDHAMLLVALGQVQWLVNL